MSSRIMDEKLSIRQSLALKLHLLLCRSCFNFTCQLKFLREVSRRSRKRSEFQLAEEARERISRAIEDNQA